MKISLPNFLVVSGTGRNVGKTTLICEIIKRFSPENRISAIKITNHFHQMDSPSTTLVSKNDGFQIYEENNINGQKDTSKYLQSGADASFLIMHSPSDMSDAFNAFSHQINIQNGLFIVESTAIIEIIDPAVHILQTYSIQNLAHKNFDVMSYFVENSIPDFDFTQISSRGNQWILK
ncbi:MAG: hypothetical protein JXR34_05870 [Bacteroidales bacterium]|nr:hypothetical protein [Bacteroidales bacterium]